MQLNAVDTAARLSVAPMMDWTDRHCRIFHRLMSRETLLYTEMVTAPALVRGGAVHLLDYSPEEHPVAVQLGGSDPEELAQATKLCVAHGYDEVNLNVGCPSDRVQSGTFGAVLMKDPGLVAECASAMIGAADGVEVTVKCRIGVDDQDPVVVLPNFLDRVTGAGVRRFAIHARKAWLQGLSPKENRDIPPLDYPLVHRMKAERPDLHLSINGGIHSLDEAARHLAAGMDGAMIGRAAYHQPADVLMTADSRMFGRPDPFNDPRDVVRAMLPYIEAHVSAGGKLAQVTKHMLGVFAGQPGARHWKRVLSERAHKPGAGPELVEAAMMELA
ncbi:tRNA dihydrouridine(20/20a) synthase DusA [Maritimibacter dapengensis]|uniref:tRNA-dihydrouridine(20/20a) synthase n=1 Tax=Maritimibacter dapengensis TaxID=2836868 RepID=A0ABS6SZP5_9RHOB|nr:tRNA dihydrouridine(20/20a) synthase DusA [Maritimibacter dapengensis]MBV7378457.1 tRNA dihydrouridine(20/20a) synthase DusA [Maritimibacter dapengensis]